MLAAIALMNVVVQQPKTIDVTPSADAWIYPHAPEPGTADLLRVWGNGSDAVERAVPPQGESSYAYFNFPIEGILGEGLKVTEAKLTVYFQKTEDLTDETTKMFPLEVRPLDLIFKDAGIHVDTLKVGPGAAIFGKGVKAEAVGTDKLKMTIDLAGKDSAFAEYLSRSASKKQLGLALVSAIFPGDSKGAIYRIFSKEGDKATLPRLTLKVVTH